MDQISLSGLNHLLEASSKSIVQRIITLVFMSRNSEQEVFLDQDFDLLFDFH